MSRSVLGSHVAINRRGYVHDSLIGNLTYAGRASTIHRARIGGLSSIAGGVEIGVAEHDMSNISTFPISHFQFARTGKLDSAAYADLGIHRMIGNDVWIATHAVVLESVNIGDGAVVGAGAIVTKDVSPYAVVVGVPASVMK